MSNLWEFLLQSMEVTLTAVMILILKWMFQDKLSPRWQYGIWAILAAKLLIPAGVSGRYMGLDLAAWLNVAKRDVEGKIISQFGDAYGEIAPNIGIPMISGMPSSVTDWIFLAYIIGVAAFIAYYLWEYVRLRMILRKGWEPTEGLQNKVRKIAETYSPHAGEVLSLRKLEPCRIIIIDGIESAFVCGFVKPVLVIPASQEETIDEKIILHELMHKAYFDGWQNGFWCIMRCIHWCNPIMHYTFNRIGNDVESLCDQRVLERINGEDRRQYGQILLDMTNQKYARAMGTTSVSNGGRNIKRRIEAIVRFKKYPKGMALVSVCICLLVASPVFGMTRQPLDFYDDFSFFDREVVQLEKIRLQGCSTVAGALDTYTKGLVYRNKYYLAASLPGEEQKSLEEIAESSPVDSHIEEFFILNLKEQEDGAMTADILLYRINEESEAYQNGEYDDQYNQGWADDVEAVTPTEDLPFDVTVLPVRVYPEKQRWVVASNGEPLKYQTASEPYWNYQKHVPAREIYERQSEKGTITLAEQTYHFLPPEESDNLWGFDLDGRAIDANPNPNGEFYRHRIQYRVSYIHDTKETTDTSDNLETVAISSRVLTKEQPEPNWSEDAYTLMYPGDETASSDGSAASITSIEDSWNSELNLEGVFDTREMLQSAKTYAIRVYINKIPGETITIERGQTP